MYPYGTGSEGGVNDLVSLLRQTRMGRKRTTAQQKLDALYRWKARNPEKVKAQKARWYARRKEA